MKGIEGHARERNKEGQQAVDARKKKGLKKTPLVEGSVVVVTECTDQEGSQEVQEPFDRHAFIEVVERADGDASAEGRARQQRLDLVRQQYRERVLGGDHAIVKFRPGEEFGWGCRVVDADARARRACRFDPPFDLACSVLFPRSSCDRHDVIPSFLERDDASPNKTIRQAKACFFCEKEE